MEENRNVILNIAAGKIDPELPNGLNFLINVDTCYFTGSIPGAIEENFNNWIKEDCKNSLKYYCNCDIFEFMERTKIRFDLITCYRFLEHVERDKVLYFIYLLSTVIKPGGIIDIIVPNYRTLAKRILHEDVTTKDFEKDNIITSTELLNEKQDPHCSIWTLQRAKYYFEFEKRFEIVEENPEEEFEGRNIYLRFKVKRI